MVPVPGVIPAHQFPSLLLLLAAAGPLAAQAVIFPEDFEKQAASPLGAPWEPQVTPGNSATVTSEAASSYSGGKQGLRLYDQSRDRSLVAAWLRLPQKLESGTVTLEFDARVDSTQSALGAYLMAVVDKPGGGVEWWTSTGMNLGGFRYGTNGWSPNVSCNSGLVAYLASGSWFDVRGIDAATAQEIVLVPKRKKLAGAIEGR